MKAKTIFIPVILFFCLAKTAKSQDKEMIDYKYTAQYKKSYKIDSLQKNYTTENFILLFNGNESAFRSVSRYLLDSIQRTASYQELNQIGRVAIAMKYPSKNEELVQTNIEQKEIVHTTFAEVMPPLNPSYKQKLTLHWKILEEYNKINNFNCKKAEIAMFGRTWTAWFAIDYPMPFGPYKFYGLPGLIVKIEDSTASYKYELYQFKIEKVRYPSEVHDHVKLVTREEYITICESGKYGMSLFEGVELDDDRYQRILEMRLKRKLTENNPLELNR